MKDKRQAHCSRLKDTKETRHVNDMCGLQLDQKDSHKRHYWDKWRNWTVY